MAVYNNLPAPAGGMGTETTLWSSTSMSSGAFTLTLSEAITNYERIRIYYYLFGDDTLAVIELKVDDLTGFTGSINSGLIALGAKGAAYNYSRYGYFNSAFTQISWTTAYRAGATNTNNAYCLPYRISGIK